MRQLTLVKRCFAQVRDVQIRFLSVASVAQMFPLGSALHISVVGCWSLQYQHLRKVSRHIEGKGSLQDNNDCTYVTEIQKTIL